MPERRRTVFFVSDGTGITVEMLGHSLLTQFDGIEFDQMTVPFIDSVDKARTCVTRINEASAAGNGRPVVFTTLVNAEIVRQSGQLGEIVAGAFADLLIVDGDPTRDLGVFQDYGAHIPAIMKGGRFVKNAL